jgi:hypothetical protein
MAQTRATRSSGGGGEFAEFAGTAGAANSAIEDDDNSAGMEIEEGEGEFVDLSNTDDSAPQYPVYPRGLYEAEMVEMEYGQSQRSGNNMWTTQWELDIPENVQPIKGKKDPDRRPRQWLHLTFTDGGMTRVKRALAAMKCEDDANLALLKGKFKPQQVADEGLLIGARARLRIDTRKFEGQLRNNVRELLPPGQGGQATGGIGGAFSRL